MPEDRGLPRDAAELLQRIEASRSALTEAIGALDERRLSEPRDDRGWSVKDHLTHLAAWERGVAFLLQGRPFYESLGVDEETYRTANVDDINAMIYERTRERSLLEVQSDFDQAHQELLAALSGVTDEDLQRPLSHFVTGGDGARPVLSLIAGNTYEHFDEHASWIAALVR